ncbi:MAG TPA: MliC family protein [Steroidobacteraceae bacterium]|nr:MliC family protein [Steroidobacteraceae bacterium]
MSHSLRAVPVARAGVFAVLAISACGERPAEVEAPAAEAPAAEASVTSMEPETVREVLYRCNSGREVAARYMAGGGKPSRVELLFDGAAYELHAVPAAEGALYATDDGRTSGRGLNWHNKGAEAALTETMAGEPAGTGVPVDSCHEQPESHAEVE